MKSKDPNMIKAQKYSKDIFKTKLQEFKKK